MNDLTAYYIKILLALGILGTVGTLLYFFLQQEPGKAPTVNQVLQEIPGVPENIDTPSILGGTREAGTEAAQMNRIKPAGEPVQTEEGVAFQDIVIGEGKLVQKGDTLQVHYVGRLENGTVFDSSVQRQQPFTFTVGEGRVIPGWEIGIEGMREGGVRQVVIPPELAYGSQERGPIPPDSTLVFVVELLAVQE